MVHRGVLSVLVASGALLLAVTASPTAGAVTSVAVAPAVVTPAAVTPAAVTPAASPTPALTVTPSAGLVDGQTISMVSTGTTPGSTFVFAQCDPVALKIFLGSLPPEDNPNDGCEEQRNTVVFSDAAGVVAGTLRAEAVVSTATGTDDCRVDQCFVALFALAGGPSVQLQNLSFGADACAAAGSCAVPADWAATSPARMAARVAAGPGLQVTPASLSTTHRPTVTSVWAAPAGDLTVAGSVSGPWDGSPLGPTTPVDPAPPVSGEGLVRVALDAPGTSWAAASPTATVVDVAVDGGQPQQLVLFGGTTPFVYAGFTGPLTTGAHTVSVTPDAGLSVSNGHALHVDVLSVGLEVVTPDNPSYLAQAYAPVMYGRSTSALHDTPLIDYAGSAPAGGGSVRLSYTVVWSHEDAGTGFVPWLELGSWGRLTDIENALSFTVAPDGTVSDATYLWGGQPPDYPDTQGALSETDVAFTGSYAGHHPILRDATGNNDFSDQGTTAFRFQEAPVAPPGPGQPREAVMDANPWTYQVMGQEMDRWYTDLSADPASPQPGDARQYAYVQLGTAGSGVTSVAVDLQLDGSSTWYQSDLGSGYPLVGTGTLRTVVKMPVGWTSHTVTAARVRVFPASAAPSVTVNQLVVRGLSSSWALATVATPAASVVGGVAADPVALTVRAGRPAKWTTGPSGAVPALTATVTDPLGEPLAGVAVTFATAAGAPLDFAACGCGSVVAVTDSHGVASSGASSAAVAGVTTESASVADPLAHPATFTIRVAVPHVS